MKKTILITGSNGLIGYTLLEKLSNNNFVYALSRKKIELKHDNFKNIICDLSKPLDVEKLPKKVDIIYHLAQSEHFRNFPEKSTDIFNVNTISTLSLLEYARIAKCKKYSRGREEG